MNSDFIKKFKIEELKVFEFDFWTVSLRPQQPTLGSLVIALKRECKYLGGLTGKETEELAKVFTKTEKLLGTCFKYDKINYLALMMVDEQVHFHVIPRYASAVNFVGTEFTDNSWPGPPDISKSYGNEGTLKEIYDTLRKNKT